MGSPRSSWRTTSIPPLDCSLLVGCASNNKLTQAYNELQYNSFNLLNTLGAGETGPTVLGSFMPDVPSGSSYQVTDWLCKAPNTPFPVTVNEVGQSSPVTVPVTDPNLASTTLTTAPIGSSIWPPYQGAPWLFPTCQGYSTFPRSPPRRARAMRSRRTPRSRPRPCAPGPSAAASSRRSSSPRRWPSGSWIRLRRRSMASSDASVQNAAGVFLPPTTASLEAAGNALTPCPSGNPNCPLGTYQVNYGNTDPTAYAMPDVTYAVVNTAPSRRHRRRQSRTCSPTWWASPIRARSRPDTRRCRTASTRPRWPTSVLTSTPYRRLRHRRPRPARRPPVPLIRGDHR